MIMVRTGFKADGRDSRNLAKGRRFTKALHTRAEKRRIFKKRETERELIACAFGRDGSRQSATFFWEHISGNSLQQLNRFSSFHYAKLKHRVQRENLSSDSRFPLNIPSTERASAAGDPFRIVRQGSGVESSRT